VAEPGGAGGGGAAPLRPDLGGGMSDLSFFVRGAIALGLWAAGLFFLRFFRRTRDPLFVFFAVAFWVMALSRLGLVLLHDRREAHTYLYAVRLLAFLLILGGIINKNRGGPGSGARRPDPGERAPTAV